MQVGSSVIGYGRDIAHASRGYIAIYSCCVYAYARYLVIAAGQDAEQLLVASSASVRTCAGVCPHLDRCRVESMCMKVLSVRDSPRGYLGIFALFFYVLVNCLSESLAISSWKCRFFTTPAPAAALACPRQCWCRAVRCACERMWR